MRQNSSNAELHVCIVACEFLMLAEAVWKFCQNWGLISWKSLYFAWQCKMSLSKMLLLLMSERIGKGSKYCWTLHIFQGALKQNANPNNENSHWPQTNWCYSCKHPQSHSNEQVPIVPRAVCGGFRVHLCRAARLWTLRDTNVWMHHSIHPWIICVLPAEPG